MSTIKKFCTFQDQATCGHAVEATTNQTSIQKAKMSSSMPHPFAVPARSLAWAQHPSLHLALDALDHYEHWVSRVVLPIAFEWIEHNRKRVYANIPDELRDDVGVVIAAAFKIVSKRRAYKRGLGQYEKFKHELATGKWKPGLVNQVWTRISNKVLEETSKAFAAESDVLMDTICLPALTPNDEHPQSRPRQRKSRGRQRRRP